LKVILDENRIVLLLKRLHLEELLLDLLLYGVQFLKLSAMQNVLDKLIHFIELRLVNEMKSSDIEVSVTYHNGLSVLELL
jgi:hypothetical protein